MESIVSAFHIDWKIIIAQLLNFGVVFVVLYLFALKPLVKIMLERSQKISQGVDDAKTNAVLREAAEKEYEDALAKAREEANKIFLAGKKEAEIKKAQMMEEAKHEVATMIEGGKKTLMAEKTQMVNEAKKEIVSLVTLAAEKLISSKEGLNSLK
jgi:F-type H+-transporting ATPase subunit b